MGSPAPTLEPTDAPASAPVPAFAVVGLSLAAMASAMSLRLADALLPRLAREFSVSLGQASQVITAFAVAYGLSQLLFGPLGDRFGKYRVVGWACVASAVASALCALAPSHGALVAGRLLAGATAAAVIPLSMAWIGDVVPYERRQTVLARFLIGQMAGFALGVWAGGYAAEHLAWRTPFFVVSVVFVAVAGVLQAMRRRLPAAATRGQPTRGAALPRMLAEFGAVLSQRWPRVVLVTVFCEGACLFGPFAFTAAHLHGRFALPLSMAGGLVMLFALGGLAFALNARVLVRRLGEPALVRWGAGLMVAGLLAMAAAPVWWWASPACVAMGIGYYMMHNTLQTQATQMAPERRGAAVAAFAACFFLGQSVGVGAAGLAVGHVAIGWVMAIGAGGVSAVAWNFNRQRRVLLAPAAGFA